MTRAANPKPNSKLLRLTMNARSISDQAQGLRTATDRTLDVAASSVKLATAAARHTWNKVLVRPR
jgi:hypothetical protein